MTTTTDIVNKFNNFYSDYNNGELLRFEELTKDQIILALLLIILDDL